MTGEVIFFIGYGVALLAVAGVLELYGRQSTSAWASRIFTGYRRAVPDAPAPADPDDWPHSEVRRFHHAISLFVVGIALVFLTVGLIRDHHDPVEILALATIGAAHALLATRFLRRLLHAAADGRGRGDAG
jgi:hypothetical protein